MWFVLFLSGVQHVTWLFVIYLRHFMVNNQTQWLCLKSVLNSYNFPTIGCLHYIACWCVGQLMNGLTVNILSYPYKESIENSAGGFDKGVGDMLLKCTLSMTTMATSKKCSVNLHVHLQFSTKLCVHSWQALKAHAVPFLWFTCIAALSSTFKGYSKCRTSYKSARLPRFLLIYSML